MCIYTHIHVYVHTYNFMYLYLHICTRVISYMYIYVYICMYTHNTFLVLKIFANLNSNTENKTRFVSGPRSISGVIQMPLKWNNGDIW